MPLGSNWVRLKVIIRLKNRFGGLCCVSFRRCMCLREESNLGLWGKSWNGRDLYVSKSLISPDVRS